MRIAHLETGRHVYGGARQVLYLMSGLESRGINNVLICTAGSGIGKQYPKDKVIEVPMAGDADVGFIWRLRRILEAEAIDLLHVHSRRGADLYGGWAASMARIPAVLSRRVDNTEVRVLAKAKYDRYAAIIGISKAIVGVLVELGLPRQKLFCVPSAVDANLYRPGPAEALHAELPSPGAGPLLGVVAQLIARKGHEDLFKALVPLAQKWPGLQVICFGQGPLLGRLKDEARRLGLSERIVFAGFRDDLPALLPGLDLVVHPAYQEGLGVALLEAQAAGLPVVAGAAGGIPEVVRHGDTGLLVPPGDVEALAQAIDQILSDDNQRESMGFAARKRIEREFSIDAMVEGNLAVYETVLEVE